MRWDCGEYRCRTDDLLHAMQASILLIFFIYSTKLDRYYIGYTADVNKRLAEHNTGISTFTSKAADWTIRYTENFTTRELAQKREMEIKRKKSRKYIEWLIQKTS